MANIPISAFTVPANTVGIGLSGFSLTGSNAQSIVDLAGTWNTTGTPTALKLNVTDTASNAASLLMDLQVGGSSRLNVQKNGFVSINGAAAAFLNTLSITNVIAGTNTLTFTIGSNASRYALGTTTNHAVSFFTNNGVDSFRIGTTGSVQIRSTATFGYSSTDDASGTADVLLARDAADTLAQRRTTNAQTFRIYNTTDSGITNYERGFVGWTSNFLCIGTEKGGTGGQRGIRLIIDGATVLELSQTSATFDGDFAIASGHQFRFETGTKLYTATNGNLIIWDNNQTSFGLLQFGGNSSSFPALKRNSTALETKLADDSAYAPHAMQYLDVTDGITAPASATGRARIYVDTADGDLKVIFADGTVKTIVTDS